MAVSTDGWSLVPGGPGNQGILTWGGSGPAPFADAGTQQALRSALSSGGGMSSGDGGGSVENPFAGLELGGGEEAPGLVPYEAQPYTPGPITSIVNDLMTAAIGGHNTQPGTAQTLHRLSKGAIPPATLAAYRQNQDLENSAITEKMGAVGNRFGTDLARTLADAAGRSNVNLSASAMDRALMAIQQIIGLGQGQQNIEFAGNQAALNRDFQGNQNALDRANQDFLASSSGDSFTSLLPLLIGLGGVGG